MLAFATAGATALIAKAGLGAANTSAATAIHPARIGVRLLCIVDPPNTSERLKTNSEGVNRFPGRVVWRRTRPICLRMAEWRPRKRTLAEPDADRLTGKQLIRVSVEGRPRTRTCVKLSPLSLPCCPFWLDVPALGRRLALTPRRYRQTPVMHRHHEPAHTGVHRGRSHRKPRDLDSRSGAPPPPPQYADQYGEGARSLDPNGPDPYAGGPGANEYDQASPSNPYGPVMRPGPQYQ